MLLLVLPEPKELTTDIFVFKIVTNGRILSNVHRCTNYVYVDCKHMVPAPKIIQRTIVITFLLGRDILVKPGQVTSTPSNVKFEFYRSTLVKNSSQIG